MNCAKCDRPVVGANRRKRMPEAHAVCPRRKNGNKVRRKRLSAARKARKLAWEVRRGECFLRDHLQCRACGAGTEAILDAHHVIKRSSGGSDDLENLVTLCRDCHNKRHPEFRTRWSGSGA